MKIVMRYCVMAMVVALLLCAAGCKKDKTAAAQSAAQATTQATQAAEASEETAPAATEEVAAATEATETSAPTGTAEQPAGTEEQPTAEQPTAEQPTTQETPVDVDQEIINEEEFPFEEEFGTGPRITVKWETYEAMSEAEKEAYRACFTTEYAFNEWEEMAMMDYETSWEEEPLGGYGSLNLKEIIELLTGEQLQ